MAIKRRRQVATTLNSQEEAKATAHAINREISLAELLRDLVKQLPDLEGV